MKKQTILVIIVTVCLIGGAWFNLLVASSNMVSHQVDVDGLPMRYLAPSEAENVPTVIIAHGFAGSQQLMLAYGYTFVKAGYAVLLFDFSGHGANSQPLQQAREILQTDIALAYETVLQQPEVDPERVALLGHSMGSGAVMSAGVNAPEQYGAVVAVSPTSADVTASEPRNLLLQAGGWERPFVENAQSLLEQAGGENHDRAGGMARSLVIVPRVEHISILFSWQSHQEALMWLNETFEHETVTPYQDTRIIWYGVHLLSWMILASVLAPVLLPFGKAETKTRPNWVWLAPLGAGALAGLLGLVVDLGQLGGVLVGGGLVIYFGLLGIILLIAHRHQIERPAPLDFVWGLCAFGLLFMAFGMLAQFTWLNWLLIPARLSKLWWMVTAVFPFTLATAHLAQADSTAKEQLKAWLVDSVMVILGLAVLMLLVDGFGFVILILPVLPPVLGLMAINGRVFARPWAVGLGNALFLGWLLLAVFPLVA